MTVYKIPCIVRDYASSSQPKLFFLVTLNKKAMSSCCHISLDMTFMGFQQREIAPLKFSASFTEIAQQYYPIFEKKKKKRL